MIYTLLLVILGLITALWLHWPLTIGFLPAVLGMVRLARSQGMAWPDLGTAARSGITQIQEILWILALIGILIPTWTATGLMPYLIQIGSEAISPHFFYASAFIITAVTSMLLGTTLGSLSVIGIPILGIAYGMNLSIPLVAGTLVSGAVVGDRSSPMSGTFNMLAAACGISPGDHFRSLLPTGITGLLSSILFYAAFDLGTGTSQNMISIQPMSDYFILHPILLSVPLVLLVAIVLRVKVRYIFLSGIAISILLGIPLQHLSIQELLYYMLRGYSGPGPAYLHSGGLAAMLPLTVFVAEIGVFNGILTRSGLIDPYIRKVLGGTPTPVMYTIRAAGFGTLLDMTTCNQTLPVILSGSSLMPVWRQHFSPASLSRVVADSTQVLAALVPWNLMALLSSQIIGVPVLSYTPYAAYIWGLPLITIVYSGMTRGKWEGQVGGKSRTVPTCE